MTSQHACTIHPSAWIERFADRVRPSGTVLDVAAGGGRHAAFFLGRGHAVTALDLAPAPAPLSGRLDWIQTDLESGAPWPLPDRRFDAIVVTNYLWRPLFAALVTALAPGGILLYETFARGNEMFGRPRNPDHLLNRGELLTLSRPLTVVAFEDGILDGLAVVQRLCAVNGPGPLPL